MYEAFLFPQRQGFIVRDVLNGLLGKKVGDVAEIKIPHGTVQLEITNISFE